jgi:hypothetical protein
MTVLLMVVGMLGSGPGQANNPNVSAALYVTEIGMFEDQAKCKAAIASAYLERKSLETASAAVNIEYQFLCIDRGQPGEP